MLHSHCIHESTNPSQLYSATVKQKQTIMLCQNFTYLHSRWMNHKCWCKWAVCVILWLHSKNGSVKNKTERNTNTSSTKRMRFTTYNFCKLPRRMLNTVHWVVEIREREMFPPAHTCKTQKTLYVLQSLSEFILHESSYLIWEHTFFWVHTFINLTVSLSPPPPNKIYINMHNPFISSIQQIPTWRGYSSSASQEIFCIVWNSKNPFLCAHTTGLYH